MTHGHSFGNNGGGMYVKYHKNLIRSAHVLVNDPRAYDDYTLYLDRKSRTTVATVMDTVF